jgi:hypothetical protein
LSQTNGFAGVRLPAEQQSGRAAVETVILCEQRHGADAQYSAAEQRQAADRDGVPDQGEPYKQSSDRQEWVRNQALVFLGQQRAAASRHRARWRFEQMIPAE